MRRVIPVPDKEDLYQDYVVNRLTLPQIAKKYGASNSMTAKKWLKESDIPVRVKRRKIPVPEKEVLCKMYLTDNMNVNDIAEHLGVSEATISRWLRGYGLTVKYDHRRASIPEKEVLRKMYLTDNMEAQEIADHFSVPRTTVTAWLHEYGLTVKREIRSASMPGKEALHKMYLIDNMSAREIAERYGVYTTTVFRWLRNYGFTIKRQNSRREVPSTAVADTEETETKA